jgi:hypothetical protein
MHHQALIYLVSAHPRSLSASTVSLAQSFRLLNGTRRTRVVFSPLSYERSFLNIPGEPGGMDGVREGSEWRAPTMISIPSQRNSKCKIEGYDLRLSCHDHPSAEPMNHSPPASSFSIARTCASAASRTSTQLSCEAVRPSPVGG